MNAIEARFQRQVKALIQEEFGRPTEYAYSHRHRGSASPKVSGSTIKQWLRNGEPSTPFSPCLLAFAEEMGATLDYVVLGRGPKTPGLSRVERKLATDLRTRVVAELCAKDGASARELEIVLDDGEDILKRITADYRSRLAYTRYLRAPDLATRLRRAAGLSSPELGLTEHGRVPALGPARVTRPARRRPRRRGRAGPQR